MEPWDAAWIAGLFEGEGCITIRQDPVKDHVAVQLQLGMTDEDVILRLAQVTGVGTVRGPIWSEKRPHKKPVWIWFCGKEQDVAWLLVHMFPFLGERRRAKVLKAAEAMSLRLSKREARAAQCGTPSGYNRHRRLEQETCRLCRDAVVASQHARRVAQVD